MRVLQLHNEHATPGGATELMHHEARVLGAGGHVVDQYLVPSAEEAGLSSLRAGAKAVWNQEASHEVTRRIHSFRPDVVHVHTPFPLMSPAVFRAAHAAGVPAVTTLHSYRYSCVVGTCVRDGRICEDCVGSRWKLAGVRHACYHDSRPASAALTLSLGLHRTIGTFDRCVSRYLTLTDFSRRLLIRDGFPAEKVQVKANSVPDPGYHERSGGSGRTVLFAGRLVDVKGVRTLLDAWAGLGSGLRLIIAGDGELRPLVEERAAADPSIDVRGWVSEAEVVQLMAAAEVTVVPSQWYEGAPLVILRSLGVGTPVLVSDLENLCTEVLADGVGWAFRTGSASDLTARLEQLRSHPAQAASMRPAARASYEARYSPTLDLARLEDVYRDVADPRRTDPASRQP